MIKINIICNSNNWFKYIKNPNNFFYNKINNLNKNYKKYKNKKVYCTLLLSGSKEIKKLNKKFRKKNKPTDVLSFPYNDKVGKNKFYLGDIIISYNYMNQPKNISNLNFKNKVVKIFIHGFLHLLGFDHKKNSDFNKMQREENKLFNLLEKKIEKII